MFTPYLPRPVSFLGLESAHGHRLKVYTITSGDESFERGRFDGGWQMAMRALPSGAAAGRPGVGFAILHQGRTGDYFILCWWDRENELPTRVFVRGEDGWRAGEGGEGVCVWDLGVIWHEREAYVRTVLSGRPDGLENYLSSVLEGNV